MSNAQSIIQIATDLQANSTKLEIVDMARALGWKGDHARAPMLQLALYVATKLAAGEHPQEFGKQQQPQAQGEAKPEQGEQQAPQAPEAPEQGEQQAPQAPEAPEQGEQQAPEQGEQQAPQAPEAPEQGEQQAPQAPEQGEQQEQEQNNVDAEWRDLLKAAGIDRPHAQLRKLYTLTVKARQNVMLIGPAASGKTFLSQQLAQLLRLPFSSISCTMGMSESQLTGWLLPVGEAGRFDYVPAPFVTSFQQASVYLLDEIDAADPNVLMLLNSATSNGFITVPQKLDKPTIQRHADMILVCGANTNGSGADELYSARAALDGSTVDRFWPMVVDYDTAYEKSLFVLPGDKSRARSASWKPSAEPITADVLAHLQEWFFALRTNTKKTRIVKIVSTRMAQRLVAGVCAGIPIDEAKVDLLMGWSDDERARVQAGV